MISEPTPAHRRAHATVAIDAAMERIRNAVARGPRSGQPTSADDAMRFELVEVALARAEKLADAIADTARTSQCAEAYALVCDGHSPMDAAYFAGLTGHDLQSIDQTAAAFHAVAADEGHAIPLSAFQSAVARLAREAFAS